MSEQAVKTEPKKLKSKVFKWTSAIVAIAILEAAAVTGAVLIMESKHNDRQKDFATLSETVLQQGKHIAELQNLPAAISANAQKIAENAGLLQLYNENFLALKDEVGNKKVEILNQQFSNLNHRLESLEETKSTDALILSAVLLIKENALYNKNFAAEADILAQLAQGQDNIASAVQTIVSLKSLPIASNDELIKNYQQIAEEFTFAVSNEQLQENKEADDNAVAKSIALIKDTVAGINFDKVVVLKKDKRTDAQKQLMEQLASLVENHDFKNAVKFIRETPEFQKTQNPELTHWIEQAERRISFDEAVSYIIAAEQKARATYEHLMTLTDDKSILDPLNFLREREIVHYQRFGECLEIVQGIQSGSTRRVFSASMRSGR